MKKILVLLLTILFFPAYALSLPAFPGAQGMGASSEGGRGGTVYIVDQLGDDATAEAAGTTFREACEASGARYVVFSVSGVIWLESRLTISNDYLTIAGQTSPGGICIAGYMVQFDGVHDVIVTHMRFRPGPLYETASGAGYAAVAISGGSALGSADSKAAAGTDPAYDIIFDHCSFSWANDTNVNVGYDYYDITFSWCSIVEPLYAAGHDDGDNHHLGMLFWGKYNSENLGSTVHHCYFGDCYYRVPEINFYGFLDQTNNVIYHTQLTYTSGIQPVYAGAITTNIKNNYMDVRHSDTGASRNAIATITNLAAYDMVYTTGCMQSTLGESTPSWNIGDYDENWGADLLSTDWQKSTEFAVRDIAVTATTMTSIYAASIVANAGANRVQSTTNLTYDSVDTGAQTNFTNNTGAWKNANTLDEESDWPIFFSPTAPTDSDSDGMSDAWETSAFGDLSKTATGDEDSDGYDNIEEYLHYLAGSEEDTACTRCCSGTGSMQ